MVRLFIWRLVSSRANRPASELTFSLVTLDLTYLQQCVRKANFLLYFLAKATCWCDVQLSSDLLDHRQQTCDGYYPNSMRQISGIYLGFICVMSENQIHFPTDKGLTLPKWCWWFSRKCHKSPKHFQPKLSAQAQKFGISLKKGFIWRS